jgi:hypothetical protein
MAWIKGLSILVVVGVVLAVVAAWWGGTRWNAATDALRTALERERSAPSPARYDAARELAGLPEPVQRFFRRSLVDGQPMIAAATVEHSGEFDMGRDAPQWRPFTSEQRVVAKRPGFAWNGHVRAFPGVVVHVHDAYAAGDGVLRPSLLGLFDLVHLRGKGEVATGEFMRFVAEAAWYPTVLLPSQGAVWTPLDSSSARVRLADGDVAVELTFTFLPDGAVQSVRAEARGRTVGDRIVATPWEGRWSDHRLVDGMTVPFTGEVAWLAPEGRRPYWRGTIQDIRYEFAR